MSPAQSHRKDAEIVAGTARAGRRDFYLAALFAPKHLRPDLLALYAFDAELARIPSLVTEPMMGEIRLQWWRDALAGADDGGGTGHPVADAFTGVMARHDLPPALTGALIDARTFDVSDGIMPDTPALTAYLGKTTGLVFELALRILGVEPRIAERVAAPAGQAYGLARVLCDVARERTGGRVFIPATLLAGHGLDTDAVLYGTAEADPFAAVVAEIARDARPALANARTAMTELPKTARPALLPLALVENYIATASAMGPTLLERPAEPGPLVRLWPIVRAGFTGRI